jgi:hypothetical protein
VTTLLTRRRAMTAMAVGALAALTDPLQALALPEPRTKTGFTRGQLPSRWFDRSFGRFIAGDNPHAYEVDADTTLWVSYDTFFGRSSRGYETIPGDATFLRNAAFTERDGKLGLVHAPTRELLSDSANRFDQWWWFHGGVVTDGTLQVVVGKMVRTGALGWAINSVHDSTWIATFDARTGAQLDLRPAPNPGTKPMYGCSIASDADWTYLYGNRVHLDETTTDNYVARVPYGQLLEPPTYWTGSEWSSDARDATIIHRGGAIAHRLHVFRHDDRWLAVCKEDEYFGKQIVLFVGGRLHIWWSNNTFAEADARADASLYRPSQRIIDAPPSALATAATASRFA